MKDTGQVAAVPRDEQLDRDEGGRSDTGMDPAQREQHMADLQAVWDRPGRVVDGPLG